jgi:hypothetical protein
MQAEVEIRFNFFAIGRRWKGPKLNRLSPWRPLRSIKSRDRPPRRPGHGSEPGRRGREKPVPARQRPGSRPAATPRPHGRDPARTWHRQRPRGRTNRWRGPTVYAMFQTAAESERFDARRAPEAYRTRIGTIDSALPRGSPAFSKQRETSKLPRPAPPPGRLAKPRCITHLTHPRHGSAGHLR